MAYYLKQLIFSPPGHGKTTYLGTGIGDDRLMPMLILDFEGGTDSILSKVNEIEIKDLGKSVPTLTKVDVLRIRDWEEFDQVEEFLRVHEGVYKSVAVDSLTEVNYLSLRRCVDIGKEMSKNNKHDPDIPEQLDYQRNAVRIRELVRMFRDLRMHVIFTAIPTEDAGQLVPNLTGRLAGEVPALVQQVSYLALLDATETESAKRVLITAPTTRFYAKDRSEDSKLGDQIVNPTLPLILDLLTDVVKKENL